MNATEPTIVQNGALYQVQHRQTKRDRERIRLRHIVADEFNRDFTGVRARAAARLQLVKVLR